MLIRVRGYNDGFAEYLRTGKKSGNHLHRDQLDKRLILSGDMDITASIVSSMPDKGDDRYLHIALPFREDYISEDILKEVLEEFKSHLMCAYDESEYAFYAEAHIPKIKRVLNEKTGEMEERRPHIHVVIPKVNLVDGSYLNPLGYYPHNEKYVESIQEVINHKYGLASPRDNRRVDITDLSDFISRYKGDFFKSDVRGFKENLLSDILQDKDITYGKFIERIKSEGVVKVRNPGQGEYLNVKPEGAAKGINLKDFVFSKSFLDLGYEEKINFILSKNTKRDESAKARDYAKDLDSLDYWTRRRSLEIKLLHPNSKEYREYKSLPDDVKDNYLSVLSKDFHNEKIKINQQNDVPTASFNKLVIESIKGKYDVRRKSTRRESTRTEANSPQPSIRNNEGEGIIQQHDRKNRRGVSRNIMRELQLGSVDASLFQQASMFLQGDTPLGLAEQQPGLPTLMRYPIDRIASGTARAGVGRLWDEHLENTPRYTIGPLSRLGDNYIESVRLNAAERIASAAQSKKHDWIKIRSQLNAQELLRNLEHTNGIDISRYSVTKSKKGEDRIRCGSRAYSVNDFLTKELSFSWQEASDYLKREFERQQRAELTNPFSAPSKNYWLKFREWDRKQNTYAEGWKALREDQARQRSLLNKTFRQKNSAVWKDESLSAMQKKNRIAALRLEKLKAKQELQLILKEERAALKVALSAQNRFHEYLRMRSEEGDYQALNELRKAVKRKEQAPQHNYFESPVDPTSVLLDKVTYSVKSNGAVSYLINNREAVVDTREWVSVVQTDNDEAIELAIRLALEKNNYHALTLNGNDDFSANVIRVAIEKGIKINFTDVKTNDMYLHMQEIYKEQNKNAQSNTSNLKM